MGLGALQRPDPNQSNILFDFVGGMANLLEQMPLEKRVLLEGSVELWLCSHSTVGMSQEIGIGLAEGFQDCSIGRLRLDVSMAAEMMGEKLLIDSCRW